MLICDQTSRIAWLKFVLVPKIIKWAGDKIDSTGSGSSLQLINLEEYVEAYNRLKSTYFEAILQAWDSESTNADKFIHEDLGIAAYLLILWKKYATPKLFVDLGCGNGLLVYLLNQEGVKGVGLDIRKRKIWNFFRSKGTDLRYTSYGGS